MRRNEVLHFRRRQLLFPMALADRLRVGARFPGIVNRARDNCCSCVDTEPSWTPDGRSLIFTSDRGGGPQIYRLELATNIVDRLTFEGRYNARGRLLADGIHLVFVHRRNGVDHIAWQDLVRNDLRVLTQTRLDESPSLAPNGAMLIYATQDAGRGILSVVSIDGRVKYRLPSSSGDVREPAWSPFMNGFG